MSSAARAADLVAHGARAIFALFVPPRCLACGEALIAGRARRMCDECLESIDRVSFEGLSCCPACGLPTAPGAIGARATQCGECSARPPRFDAARSFGLYDGALRDAVLALKFGRRTGIAAPLGALVARAAESLPAADAVIAVPLHRSRLRERGFDQAAMLARVAARSLDLPRLAGALVRVAATGPQSARGRASRAANVRGVMRADRRAVEGRAVLLVDDVLTTGATATACADALRAAGARAVFVATVARALPGGAGVTIDAP